MRINNRVVSDGNFKFDIVADNGEKNYELIRVAELLNDFVTRRCKVLRPFAFRINSEGGENITTGSESFVETVVDLIYKFTQYNYRASDGANNHVKFRVEQPTLTMGELGELLRERGIQNTIDKTDTTLFVHSLVGYIELEFLFDYIGVDEKDCEDVFYRNNVDKYRYFPCFITSKYGMKYSLVDDNLLSVDLDLYCSDIEQILVDSINSIRQVLSEMCP